jgi:sec-independent protein translocase protein TatA
MGGLSIWHWLVVGVVLLLVFGGRGKVSDLMGDVAKGIKSFKKGLADDEADTPAKSDAPMRSIDHQAPAQPAADVNRSAAADSKVERTVS